MSRSLVVVAVAALLLILAPAASAQLLSQEPNVTVDGALSDRFTWVDASGQLRSASLAHNDVQDPTGNFGGKLWQYTYVVGPGTRTVGSEHGTTFGGFGYMVSHRGTPGADNSALGHGFAGQFLRVFQGRHHAIFRFTQLYPRNSANDVDLYNVPVTMDWIFSTGRDHPLWAATWDMSSVPANAIADDSRGPYGQMLFDGSPEGNHSTIQGVAWGDRYKFQTPGLVPVTYNSDWDYTPLNSIPYVKLWTTDVDALMGLVQTQTIQQKDAGGYFQFNTWGTSSNGDACLVNEEEPMPSLAHKMPCSFNWSYQTLNYEMGHAGGGDDNDTTTSTRLAWGTPYGFLGQTAYDVRGSVNVGGPVGDGADPNYGGDSPTAVGYPRNSYSIFVVLGLESEDFDRGVLGQRIQMENVQRPTLFTAAVGTVKTTGPKGVNNPDSGPYAPAGWNHVYAAWAVQASGSSAVDVNWNTAGGSQKNPLLIVSGWTTDLPSAVRFNAVTLVQDIDYFPSVRAGAQELWLTLNRELGGPDNRLEIDPGAALPPPPPGGSGSFFTVTPCRVADTRDPAGPSGGPALAANTTRNFPAAGLCGIPTDATAVAINVTVVEETDFGDLRLYPAGGAVPTSSTINFTPNHVRANNAIIPLGTGGQISVQCDMLPGSTGTTQFLFDVTGYFK